MASTKAVVDNCNCFIGVILNLLLLYAIRRFTRKSLGSYKHLLTIFAAYDAFLEVLHAAVKPRVILLDTIFGVVSEGFENRPIMSIYCASFTVPFALMNIHFLYRFCSIRHPHLIPLFSTGKHIALLISLAHLEFVTWNLLCYYRSSGDMPDDDGAVLLSEASGRIFGQEFRNGWIVMNYWEDEVFQPRPFWTMIAVHVIMIVLLAATLGGLTFNHIKRADTMSLQTHSLQLKLFFAVCAQTFVPLIFVYIPYFCAINFPFFRIKNFFFDDACMQLTSAFPAWNAIIIIALMKDYREGLIGMFRKKNTLVMGATMFITTQVMPVQSTISVVD